MLRVKEWISPFLKNPTRSVARQAKEYGGEEHRRMEGSRGAPRKRQDLLWQKPLSPIKSNDQLSEAHKAAIPSQRDTRAPQIFSVSIVFSRDTHVVMNITPVPS